MKHFFISLFLLVLGGYKPVGTAFVFFPMMSTRCSLNINDPVILLEVELTFSFLFGEGLRENIFGVWVCVPVLADFLPF